MKIIFIGPPGSGKGTQSEIVSKKYNIPAVSSGDLLRNQSKNNYITKLISQGYLIEDNLIAKIILKRLKSQDCAKGFILDGFPRTLYQAKIIKSINVNFIFELFIPEKLVLSRISGRMIHKKSGKICHIDDIHTQSNYLKNKNYDEILKKRSDDCIDVLKIRMKEYYKNCFILSNFYKQESFKKKLKYYFIDASLTIEQINQKIIKIIETNKIQ